jgi:oligopeptide/dipeptide ABC transporter ATP-binding protein
MNTYPLLGVDHLRVEYPVRHRPPIRAVDDVTFAIGPHETVGLVGESGSGKTTIASAVLGFVPTAAGTITFDGEDIVGATRDRRRRLSASLQVVFQDPYSSLNPSRTIGTTLSETLRPHGSASKPEVADRVASILERVGLDAAAADRYPNQFSGGQRQRIAIARALIVRPRLVICDEPVSSLDLSVQAQVLNLLRSLQDELGLSYLFISHDLAVVRHISRRVVVLYQGRVMEAGPAAVVYHHPAHPYTRALLEAVPIPDPSLQRARRSARRRSTPDLPSTVKTESCPFATRCAWAADVCREQQPPEELTSEGVFVACHRWREFAALPSRHQSRRRPTPAPDCGSPQATGRAG